MRRRDFELQHKRDLNLKDVALHHHGFYEVYFLLTGDVTYLIENKLIHVMPGDILLIPPRVQHQVLIRPEMAAYERYVLWIDPHMLGRLSSADTDLTQRFSPERIGGSFQLAPAGGFCLPGHVQTGDCGSLREHKFFAQRRIRLAAGTQAQ
jgi:hypothetical protein